MTDNHDPFSNHGRHSLPRGILILFLVFLAWQLGRFKMNDTSQESWVTTATKYQSKGINSTYMFRTSSLSLPPVRVLNQYIREHGQATLLGEASNFRRHQQKMPPATEPMSSFNMTNSNTLFPFDTHRQFALCFYSCPNRAGNILHSFFNTFLWAILTNRTVLVQWDADSKENSNSSACRGIVELQPWLGRYVDWKHVLPPPVPLQLQLTTKPNKNKEDNQQRHHVDTLRQQWQKLVQPRVAVFPPIGAIQGKHYKDLERVSWTQDPVRLSKLVSFQKGFVPQYSHNRAAAWWQVRVRARRQRRRLYSLGRNFLYGMLFRACFRVLVKAQQPQRQPLEPTSRHPGISLALHSRHPRATDDGSNVTDEQQCLHQLIRKQQEHILRRQRYQDHNTSCIVYIMSDRTATVSELSTWLKREYGCHAQSASWKADGSNTTTATSKSAQTNEHGPFAGSGFWKDLEWCAQARTGLVADLGRSSSTLLQELMEYDTYVEYHSYYLKNQKWSRHIKLPVCRLPKRLP